MLTPRAIVLLAALVTGLLLAGLGRCKAHDAPTGISFRVKCDTFVSAGTARNIYIKNPSDTDTAPSQTLAPLSSIKTDSTGNSISGQVDAVTNTSSQIAARADGASTTLRMSPLGWWDMRGKNA